MDNNIRIIFRNIKSESEASLLYDKLVKFIEDNNIKIVDFNIITTTFEKYMESIFERRDFKSDEDIQFLHTDEDINNNIEYFRNCWENELSPYKALTFLNIK